MHNVLKNGKTFSNGCGSVAVNFSIYLCSVLFLGFTVFNTAVIFRIYRITPQLYLDNTTDVSRLHCTTPPLNLEFTVQHFVVSSFHCI